MIAEGTPAEIQIVLGWLLNTRQLLVSLPAADKFIAWANDVHEIIDRRTVRKDELDSLIGRLNHAAAIMPMTRHFIGRLRALNNSKTKGFKWFNIRGHVLHDLELWLSFLKKASEGLSLNTLVSRRPDHVCWSDACPYGIEGYSLSGQAWRILIPRCYLATKE